MTSSIVSLVRQFKIGATLLQDIDPSASPEAVLKLYEPNYPFLKGASIGEPTVEGNHLVYHVQKPVVQTKGAKAKSSVDEAEQALKNMEVWASKGVSLRSAPNRWNPVHQYLQEYSQQPAPSIINPFLIPLA